MPASLYDRLNQPHQDNLIWLRLFAAAMVIYGHSYALSPQSPMQFDLIARAIPGTYAGAFGVDLFFLLSGILITHSWFKTNSSTRFASARIRRIFPGLVVCVVLSATVLGPLMSELDIAHYFADGRWLRYWLGNGSLLDMNYELPGVFLANPYPRVVNGSLWSLKVEVLCYAAVLVAGLVLQRIAVPRAAQSLALFMSVLFLLSPLMRQLPLSAEVPRAAAYFALGALLSINAKHITLNGAVWSAILVLAWSGANYLDPNQLPAACARAFALASFLMLCGYCIKPWSPPVFGDASYGVYLYGFPIQQSLMQLFPTWGPLQLTFPSLALALACGIASFHWVEKRYLRRRATN